MKKWLIILTVLIIAFICSVYILIPAEQTFTYSTEVNCTNEAATRFLVNKSRWQQWWPGEKKEEHVYTYKKYNYRITKLLLNGFEATIFNEKDSVAGWLNMQPSGNNAVTFEWQSQFSYPGNPVTRLMLYKEATEIKKNIESLLLDIKKFFDEEKNVYGFTASVQKVTDEFLITVKQPMDHSPSTEEIYGIIKDIKNYISQKGGKEKNPPMLNVHNEVPGKYDVMVAIPTTRQLPQEGKFLYREMVLGNILVADVTGGVYKVQKAEEELNNYVFDHQKTSPAIPYQSLVTDRVAEKDTAKWITRLYYPVFY